MTAQAAVHLAQRALRDAIAREQALSPQATHAERTWACWEHDQAFLAYELAMSRMTDQLDREHAQRLLHDAMAEVSF